MVDGDLQKIEIQLTKDRMHVVTPVIEADTRLLRFPFVRVVSFSVRKQMSYKPSLSTNVHASRLPRAMAMKTALYD